MIFHPSSTWSSKLSAQRLFLLCSSIITKLYIFNLNTYTCLFHVCPTVVLLDDINIQVDYSSLLSSEFMFILDFDYVDFPIRGHTPDLVCATEIAPFAV